MLISFSSSTNTIRSTHLEHIVGRGLIEKDFTEGREKGSRRATLEAAINIVGHQQKHTKLLQRHQLEIPFITDTRLQPFEQRVGIDAVHNWTAKLPTNPESRKYEFQIKISFHTFYRQSLTSHAKETLETVVLEHTTSIAVQLTHK